MKIVHLSTSDVIGGAAISAYRLHKGLLAIGEDSSMVVSRKHSSDDTVHYVSQQEGEEDGNLLFDIAQQYYIDANRSALSSTIFTLPYPGMDLSSLPTIREADVINLHWIARFQSPITLSKLFALEKPIIWTLHDQWAFTGGCHYTAGCLGYRDECKACPQLENDPFGLPAATLQDKHELLSLNHLTIVTPSQWMADCARESRLFENCKVEVIPYSIDTERFKPLPKSEAKEGLGIDRDALTLLYVSQSLEVRRKGWSELVAAVNLILENPEVQSLIENKKIKLILMGHSEDSVLEIGIPYIKLGHVDSTEAIVQAYAAADLFVLPSVEDNLPNTILEAMSVGIPVIAFATGGIPEVVENGSTGILIPEHDVGNLAKAIIDLVLNQETRSEMGRNCRKKMREQYSLDVQARHYLQLYEMLNRENAGQVHSVDAKLPKGEHLEDDLDIQSNWPIVVDYNLGPYFQNIQDSILLEGLKKYYSIRESQNEIQSTLLQKRSEQLQNQREQIERQREQIEQQRERMEQQNERIERQNEQLRQQALDLEHLRLELDRIVNSNSWKMTRPMRMTASKIKRLFDKKIDVPLDPDASSTNEYRD